MAQWLSGRFGISCWSARRWIHAAHALEELPLMSVALEDGRLSLDKVLELSRFATSASEGSLIAWARRVSVAALRHKAEVAARRSIEEARDYDRCRSLRWCFNDGRMGLYGEFPAAQGRAIATAIARVAERLPELPADLSYEGYPDSAEERLEQRRADALWALAATTIATDADVDRATVVVHTTLEGRTGAVGGAGARGVTNGGVRVAEPVRGASGRPHGPLPLGSRLPRSPIRVMTMPRWLQPGDHSSALSASGSSTSEGGCEGDVMEGPGCGFEDGTVVHPEIGRRLSCDARLQIVLEDSSGNALGIGRAGRNIPAWLMRQLRYRDHGCTFPGCGTRAFLQAHHIVHWEHGGATDLSNLTLTCCFHHKLVHEYGWTVALDEASVALWFRPGGRRYDPGPDPPRQLDIALAQARDSLCDLTGGGSPFTIAPQRAAG